MSETTRATRADRMRSRDQGRILLVTDDPATAVYGTSLEGAGFAVVGVAGGAAALVSLGRTRPHLIIADAKLKRIGGEDLARMLAQSKENVPLLLIGETASTPRLREAAMNAGAYDYFALPAELSLLISRAAQLVSLKQTLERLRAEADRDYLTGLMNRRRFRTALGNEVERWRRYKTPFALLMVDIDHLKRVNDTHGHSAGDRVIRHIASALVEFSRDNDTSARLGGEEFALLLAGIDDVKAYKAAERLRQFVSSTPVEGVGIVTVSLGVASCPAHATSERALYAASDAALYLAKDEGRDRTGVAPLISAAQAAAR
jgi:diguanylate cyclase (GGDEF)-like protein